MYFTENTKVYLNSLYVLAKATGKVVSEIHQVLLSLSVY